MSNWFWVYLKLKGVLLKEKNDLFVTKEKLFNEWMKKEEKKRLYIGRYIPIENN